MPEVEIIWDGQPVMFDLADLETAWITCVDTSDPDGPAAAVRHLVRQKGWPRDRAATYVVAASRWGEQGKPGGKSASYQWPSDARQQKMCQRRDTTLCVAMGPALGGCPVCTPERYTDDELGTYGIIRKPGK